MSKLVVVSVVAAALTGCATDAAQVTPAPVDVRPTGPLTDLAACGPPPSSGPGGIPTSVPWPPGTVVTGVDPVENISNVFGYLPLTPSQARRYFDGLEDFTSITLEDETYDAEALITDGTTRVFLKFLATCAQGSDFLAVLSPEELHAPPSP